MPIIQQYTVFKRHYSCATPYKYNLNLVMLPYARLLMAVRWHDLLWLYFKLLTKSSCTEFIHVCLQVCVSMLAAYQLPISHYIIIFVWDLVSLHMQVRLRSINVARGDLWSAAGEQNTPLTHSTYWLFGWMIYEPCPRVAGFIFLLLTAPALQRLGPLWDEGEEKPDFFDPWIHQTGPDVQLSFSEMELGWSQRVWCQ